MTDVERAITVLPANEVSRDDLRAVLGSSATSARCWCQRYKLHRGEAFAGFPAEERAERLFEQAACADPDAAATAGLVAYVDGQPAGWCAVEPRPAYHGMVRNQRVPWEGRDEDRADPSVWAVTCFVTRRGFRRQGVAAALAGAAVDFARARGAEAIEGYPIATTEVILEELHVGTVGMFRDAGFVEVHRPTPRRVVMRLEF